MIEDGRIIQMCREPARLARRRSAWAGETDINSCSIGIEIVNPGHDYGYPDFPPRQIAAVDRAVPRHPDPQHRSAPERVAGAFRRGAEPQARSRRKISLEAVGRIRRRLWVEPAPVLPEPVSIPATAATKVTELQKMLAEYGYGIDVTGHYDMSPRRSSRVPAPLPPGAGRRHADASTLLTLRKLLIARDCQAAEADAEACAAAQRDYAPCP